MSKVFITFCGGHSKYYDAANRLHNQVKSLKLFDYTKIFTDKELINDENFWNKHENFVKTHPRGWGYWLWKPYIIKKTMDRLEDNDILMYLDSGCEVDVRKKDKMLKCFQYAKKNFIVGSQNCIERRWNKMDLMVKLDVINDKFLNAKQHEAGANMFYVNEKTRKLVDTWYNLACDYHNIDDSPSQFPNFVNFVEHRHDQSIFSLLTKKMDIYCYDYSITNAIEYIRNCSGNSTLTSQPS